MDSTATSSNKCLVSIVIPNYNYVHYLEQRFDTILKQTFSSYEIIFLDDASTDNSVEFVRNKYAEYISIFNVNPQNSGTPFAQWNKGVRLSRGKYVWIAEADDYCTSNFLEQMIPIMENNPSVGLAYCNTLPVDSDGRIIDDNFFHRYVSDLQASRWEHNFVNQGTDEVRKYLANKNTITNVSGVLFRRDVYINAGYAPEDMRMCGDWMTYCRVLIHSNVAYINEPLNFHRQHPQKHTTNSVLNLTYFREFLQVQEYLMSNFNLGKKEKNKAFLRFLGEWSRLTGSSYGRINLAGTLSIARMTAEVYSTPLNRLLIGLHFFINCLRSVLYKWIKN